MPTRVYDYYAPELYQEIMVNAYSLYQLSICHVCGSYQCPYCPIYSGAFFNFINWSVIVANLVITILLVNFVEKFHFDDSIF